MTERFIVVGSFNAAKAAEIAELLVGLPVGVRTARDFAGVTSPPEPGVTFGENARAKATGIAAQIRAEGCLGVVADDSGLEVDALGGRPGVYSARYRGENATDPERVQGILAELAGLPFDDRTARFRCHVAFADAASVMLETEGVVEGRISFTPAGDFGFGYDPIFVPLGHEATFAQLGASIKHRISHRAQALHLFRERLEKWLDKGR